MNDDNDAVEIPLSKGYVALISTIDYPLISQCNWFVQCFQHTNYAACNGLNGHLLMHRAILQPPKGMVVDHINCNGLDNRRCNIRVVTPSQNMARMRMTKRLNTTPYRGVCMRRKAKANPWMAYCAGKHLGVFPTDIEAAIAYNAAALQTYGEFAVLNEIPRIAL